MLLGLLCGLSIVPGGFRRIRCGLRGRFGGLGGGFGLPFLCQHGDCSRFTVYRAATAGENAANLPSVHGQRDVIQLQTILIVTRDLHTVEVLGRILAVVDRLAVGADKLPFKFLRIVRSGRKLGKPTLGDSFLAGMLGDHRQRILLGDDRQLGIVAVDTLLRTYKSAADITAVQAQGDVADDKLFRVRAGDLAQCFGQSGAGNGVAIGIDQFPGILPGIVGSCDEGHGLAFHDGFTGGMLGNLGRTLTGFLLGRTDGHVDLNVVFTALTNHRHVQTVVARLCGCAGKLHNAVAGEDDHHTRYISGMLCAFHNIIVDLENPEGRGDSHRACKLHMLHSLHRYRHDPCEQAHQHQRQTENACHFFHVSQLLFITYRRIAHPL